MAAVSVAGGCSSAKAEAANDAAAAARARARIMGATGNPSMHASLVRAAVPFIVIIRVGTGIFVQAREEVSNALPVL